MYKQGKYVPIDWGGQVGCELLQGIWAWPWDYQHVGGDKGYYCLPSPPQACGYGCLAPFLFGPSCSLLSFIFVAIDWSWYLWLDERKRYQLNRTFWQSSSKIEWATMSLFSLISGGVPAEMLSPAKSWKWVLGTRRVGEIALEDYSPFLWTFVVPSQLLVPARCFSVSFDSQGSRHWASFPL